MNATAGLAATLITLGAIQQISDSQKEASWSPTHSAIGLSIAVPEHSGRRTIVVRDRSSHLHVVLENNSHQPQKLWREWCSWGHDALSFELVDETGRRTVVRRTPVVRKKNFPDALILGPGEKLVTDVYLASDAWEGFALPEVGAALTVTAWAVYEVVEDEQARKLGVWTGKVVSQPLRLVIENRMK